MTWSQETRPQASPSSGAAWFLTTVICRAVLLPAAGRFVDARGSKRAFLAGVLSGGALAALIGDRGAQPMREAGPC